MKIILEGEKTISWNSLYAGRHWRYRAAEARRVHDVVRYAVLEQHPGVEPFPEGQLVAIEVVVYFKTRRMLDADNICDKLIIDGLTHAGIISDDSPKYVDSVTTKSRYDKKNPRVEISVTPI
jgi:Holliday junction resolvase RusA-like endonuclease